MGNFRGVWGTLVLLLIMSGCSGFAENYDAGIPIASFTTDSIGYSEYTLELANVNWKTASMEKIEGIANLEEFALGLETVELDRNQIIYIKFEKDKKRDGDITVPKVEVSIYKSGKREDPIHNFECLFDDECPSEERRIVLPAESGQYFIEVNLKSQGNKAQYVSIIDIK
ncbi:hypothetical protein [Halalkalibacter okhensis]|uniref:Lipoprotein n=1 Tax=Halalkalibacter okhensis TaxID=333138 RepID=A0A0B0ICD7_9BACI|nr:hypothetical protein [Halalkalibacter okhensis]KHF38552.1 hypothetical protein LQ50_20600 [Halalkalibacter okhensis]